MKTEQVFLHNQSSYSWTTITDMFFIQLYRVKSDLGVIILQISGGKFLSLLNNVIKATANSYIT